MTDKICKDCKHYKLDGRLTVGAQHRCNRPRVNMVTGETKPLDIICEAERPEIGAAPGMCGIEGRFWEPRT